MYSPQDSTPKKLKKHKKDKDRLRDKYGIQAPTSGNARLKLILKVGGSSTPEHSDSPGPPMSHVVNIPYDDDSRSSSFSHSRKSKKKEKKKKKDKKHKHKRKEQERGVLSNANKLSLLPEETVLDQTEGSEEPGAKKIKLTMGEGGQGQPEVTALKSISKTGKPKIFDKVALQRMLDHLLRLLQKKDPQQFFAWPVTDKIAPGYSTIISNPMDFCSIRHKVENSEYETLMDFKNDFSLMCNNAMRYNHAETVYFKAAKKLLQSGLKILDPEKIRALVPLLPSIRVLQEEQLGFSLFEEPSNEGVSQSEEEALEVILDPTKSIHYVPPHPNDPPDLCGAFTDDLTTEEVLHQARLAAREVANRLALKKPNSKMGFLRVKEDGSTSLAILTPSNGVTPGTKEQPVCLGVLTGKLSHGSSQLNSIREDKKSFNKPSKPLNYGSFSSFAPNHDSTFASLTADEQELVQATYGDDATVQYSDSIIEFAKGCDYAMRMVDEILDTLTKGEHSRTVNYIEERKKLEAEEAALQKQQELYEASIREENKFIESIGFPKISDEDLIPIDFNFIKTLQEIGIDTKFVDDIQPSLVGSEIINGKLEETAHLIGSLKKLQNERLSKPTIPAPPYIQSPQEAEIQLSDKITENLIELVKQTVPGNIISESALHKAMGIDINAYAINKAHLQNAKDAAAVTSNESNNELAKDAWGLKTNA